MSLPSGCAGGCGAESKLELVAASELDELITLEHEAEKRAEALTAVLERFLALPDGGLPNELHVSAHPALREHEHDYQAATAVLAAEPEPVVSWWCERCGGLDAPAPCVGVCVRRPAQWASLEALERQREATAARLHDERQLAGAVRALVLTRPRPGSERRHWQALRELAGGALADQSGSAAASRCCSARRRRRPSETTSQAMPAHTRTTRTGVPAPSRA
jgi:hypothetical protein